MYTLIDLYIHIYIPNQAIRVAKLCFYWDFFGGVEEDLLQNQ